MYYFELLNYLFFSVVCWDPVCRSALRCPAYLAPILALLSSIVGDNILYFYDSSPLSTIYQYIFIYLFDV